MGDITRLPKWAQQRIETLERNVEHWKARATAGPAESDTFVTGYTVPDQPLGRRPTIKFVLADGQEVEAKMDESRTFVTVTALHAALAVQPQSSNVVRVAAQEYWR